MLVGIAVSSNSLAATGSDADAAPTDATAAASGSDSGSAALQQRFAQLDASFNIPEYGKFRGAL
jgi:hypothetical protein